jgi:hypothetical protein
MIQLSNHLYLKVLLVHKKITTTTVVTKLMMKKKRMSWIQSPHTLPLLLKGGIDLTN